VTQLSLPLAVRLGEHAMQRTQIRAENAGPGFTQRAGDFILWYLRVRGPTPGEMLTDLAKAHGMRPPDDRAFGSVFRMLVRRGEIRQAGWCERRKGHGTGGGRVWEAA
jgi:hypothetical protein